MVKKALNRWRRVPRLPHLHIARLQQTVSGFPAGGGADSIVRVFIPAMERGLGQPVIIDYRPGAFNVVGTQALVKSVPDGYTIGVGGKVDIIMGDARLSMEREEPQRFDVLALDAFSSDAIPVHLLTKEAVAIYGKHLAPDGVLAVHISNRYLDLEPVVENVAKEFGYERLSISDGDGERDWWIYSSTWVLLSKNKIDVVCR